MLSNSCAAPISLNHEKLLSITSIFSKSQFCLLSTTIPMVPFSNNRTIVFQLFKYIFSKKSNKFFLSGFYLGKKYAKEDKLNFVAVSLSIDLGFNIQVICRNI